MEDNLDQLIHIKLRLETRNPKSETWFQLMCAFVKDQTMYEIEYTSTECLIYSTFYADEDDDGEIKDGMIELGHHIVQWANISDVIINLI